MLVIILDYSLLVLFLCNVTGFNSTSVLLSKQKAKTEKCLKPFSRCLLVYFKEAFVSNVMGIITNVLVLHGLA